MSKKLKVACLHGYGTNSKFLQRQMRSFRKQFDRDFQFVFIQGTFETPHGFILDEKVLKMIEGQTRSWNPMASFKYDQKNFYDQVMKQFEKIFNTDQQYDGIMGFSQGAVMAQSLVKFDRQGIINWKGLKNIKFCIIVSGNHWNWQQNLIDSTVAIDLPSVHLVSQSDFLYRKSIFTIAQFKDPLVIHHSFGHSFPRLGRIQFNLIRSYIRNAVKQQNTKNVPINQSRL